MRIVQSLIGGLLGSAIGTGLYYALVTNLKRPMPWAVVIIGILAGLGVRVLCGKNRNLITGLMATATALVALLGYNFATISAAAADLSAPPVNSEAEEYPPWVDEVEISDEDEIDSEDDEDANADSDEDAAGDDGEGDSDNDPAGETSDDGDAQDEDPDDADNEAAEARAAADPEPTLDGQTLGPVLPTAPSSQTDAIALALTGLLAYVIGRGNGTEQSAQSPDSSPAT